MSLSEKLDQDMKQAMREKDQVKLSTIRFLKSFIKNREIDKKAVLTEEEIIDAVQKQIKQRKDVIPDFEKVSRQDLIDAAKKEIAILEIYLPAQLSLDDLKAIIAKAISDVGASSPKDMGKVMAKILPDIKGKADGKVASDIVKSLLTG